MYIVCKRAASADGKLSESAYRFGTAKALGLDKFLYRTKAQAAKDAKRLNEHNPGGYYGVVRVTENFTAEQLLDELLKRVPTTKKDTGS